jgi:uncharacterized membrane protein YfcA
MPFEMLLGLIAVVAGVVATISGFGIGSFLTPTLAMATNTKLAVAAVAIPHLIGSAVRFWKLRQHIDTSLLYSFGLMSALGGLIGALLHTVLHSVLLKVVFGLLLMFAGLMGVTGFIDRMRFYGHGAWAAGFLSGTLGGVVGTQGGIRAVALLGFELSKETFVATATAVALIIDGIRAPIYLVSHSKELMEIWTLIFWGTIGVVIGTAGGEHVLKTIPESAFRRLVSALLIVLGFYMAFVQRT